MKTQNSYSEKVDPLWLLTISIVFGLTLPILIQDAMFQDAMLYSSVSHNLSIGFGTFWFPQYSTLNLEGIPSFHEQPPLVFGIQALFYSLLGDSYYVERFYTFLMMLLNIWLINKLWKQVNIQKPDLKSFGWLPVFFWITIPVCFWSFRNNMLENTVSVFTLSSIIISLRSIRSDRPNYGWWLLSGFFIFLASFSKGIPGFFPVSFPFIYWMVNRKIHFKQCVLYTALLVAVPVVLYSVLLFLPESRHSLSIYFFDRLIGRVNTMPTVGNRLATLWMLFTELAPAMVVVLLTILLNKQGRWNAYWSDSKKSFWLFMAIGFSGSLPLILTMVQKRWYLVPAYPFFAIAFSVLLAPILATAIKRINLKGSKYNLFKGFTIVLFIGVLMFTWMQRGKISREEAVLSDVYKVGKVVPRFSTMTVPEQMYDQYNFVLQGFLVRYFNISISPYKFYNYYLTKKSGSYLIPPNYSKMEIGLNTYNLYKRNSN